MESRASLGPRSGPPGVFVAERAGLSGQAIRAPPCSAFQRVPETKDWARAAFKEQRRCRRRMRGPAPCRSSYVPYPFSETDYYRASLQLVQIADVVSGDGGC